MKFVICSNKEELLKNGITLIIEKNENIYLLNKHDTPDNIEDKTNIIGTTCFNKKILFHLVRLNNIHELTKKATPDNDVATRVQIYSEIIDFLENHSKLKLKTESFVTLCLINNLKTILMLSFDKYYKKYFEKYESMKTQYIVDITNEIKEFIDFIGKLIELKDPIIADVINNKTDMCNECVFDNYFLKTTKKKYKNAVTVK